MASIIAHGYVDNAPVSATNPMPVQVAVALPPPVGTQDVNIVSQTGGDLDVNVTGGSVTVVPSGVQDVRVTASTTTQPVSIAGNQAVDIAAQSLGPVAVSGTVTATPSGTQDVNILSQTGGDVDVNITGGSVTAVPSGVQDVRVTASTTTQPVSIAGNQAVDIAAQSLGTVAVSGTVTATPSGTQDVNILSQTGGDVDVNITGGSVTAVPSGTQNIDIVAQTLGPVAVSGTVTATPSGTQDVNILSQTGGDVDVNITGGSVTAVPSGVQDVRVTASTTTQPVSITGNQAIDIAAQSLGPVAVSGTITATPSGTQDVNILSQTGGDVDVNITGGSVTTVPSGTQNIDIVAQTLGPVAVSGTVTATPSGTQDVNILSQTGGDVDVNITGGSVTAVPSGVQDVRVTASTTTQPVSITGNQAIDIAAQSLGPVAVSGTVTATPSGTQDVNILSQTGGDVDVNITGGSVTAVPSGTQNIDIVAQTLGPIAVSGTVTATPSGTQDVNIISQTGGDVDVNITGGSVTAVPSGVQDVRVTASTTTQPVSIAGNQAIDIAAQSLGTVAVSGTVTATPSGTQDVNILSQTGGDVDVNVTGGSVTTVPSGTQNIDIVAQTLGNVAVDIAAQSLSPLVVNNTTQNPNVIFDGTTVTETDALPVISTDVTSSLGRGVAYGPYVGLVDKFGYNDDIDTGTAPEVVWTKGGPFTINAADGTASVVSTSAGDSGVAFQVTLSGIDTAGNYTSEVVQLNGIIPVISATTWNRITRTSTSGTSACAGTVSCTVGGVTVAEQTPEAQQTQQAHTATNATTGILIYQIFFSFINAAGAGRVDWSIRSQVKGTTASRMRYNGSTSEQRSVAINLPVPIRIDADTDVWIQVDASTTTNARVYGTFSGLVFTV